MSLTGPLAYFRSNLSSLLLLLSSRLPHTPHICKPRLRAAQNYWLPKRQRRQAPAVDESSAFLPHCNWADKGGEAGVACTRHTQRDAWGGGMPVASRGSNSSIVHTVAGRKELDRTSPDWNRPTPLLFHHHYSIQNSIKMLPPTGLEWRLALFCAPGENSSWWFAHTYWDTGWPEHKLSFVRHHDNTLGNSQSSLGCHDSVKYVSTAQQTRSQKWQHNLHFFSIPDTEES